MGINLVFGMELNRCKFFFLLMQNVEKYQNSIFQAYKHSVRVGHHFHTKNYQGKIFLVHTVLCRKMLLYKS